MNRRDTIVIGFVINIILMFSLCVTAKYKGRQKNECAPSALPMRTVDLLPSTPVVEVKDKVEKPVVDASPAKISKEELALQFASEQPVIVQNLAPAAPVSPLPKKEVPVEEKVEPTPSKETFTTVIVKKGDFLERIAKANHTTVSVLMRLNDLSSTNLKIGQVIKVPVSDRVPEENRKAKIASPDDFYTIQEGDSPWSIALRHGIRLEELLKMNDLDEQKARRLRPGDQLRIR